MYETPAYQEVNPMNENSRMGLMFPVLVSAAVVVFVGAVVYAVGLWISGPD